MSNFGAEIVVDLALALLTCYFTYLWLSRRFNSPYASLPLPPSLRGWPLVGNLPDMPTRTVHRWKVFHKWCKELNTGIMHLNVAGSSVIVLDTYDDCIELLEKRSSLYSGRMRMPMINELMGYSFHLAGMNYGMTWRQRRRLMHNSFHPVAAKSFQPLQLRLARKFLLELSRKTDIIPALKQLIGETILSIAYGLDIRKNDDPYIMAADEGAKVTEGIPYPGTFLVDVLPILKYVPEWMPGASFKRKARVWRARVEKMVNLPFQACLHEIERGTAIPSLSSTGLQNMLTSKVGIYTEENIKSVAASLYIAGVDTTQSTIGCCLLMLLDHPAFMKKIQAEIDAVTNGTRLPDFDDEGDLSYLKAFIKEVMRYWTLVPLSLPHYLEVEDEYKGFRIPAGSNIIPNTWAVLHDEEIFPDPFTLNPDRFLSGDNLEAVNARYNTAWGYGRRVCPGRYMASASTWITLAQILAIYDVSKAKDDDGKIIEPSHEPASLAITVMPSRFQCSFTVRSTAAEMLLKEIE